MNPTQYNAVDGAALGKVPVGQGICLHQRAVVTSTAAPLGTFITPVGQAQTGIPYRIAPAIPYPGNRVFPKAVNLQIESGQSGVIYVTMDGHDTALGDVSATLGMNVIPDARGWTRIPVDCSPTEGENGTGLIRCKASVASLNVQCLFEF